MRLQFIIGYVVCAIIAVFAGSAAFKALTIGPLQERVPVTAAQESSGRRAITGVIMDAYVPLMESDLLGEETEWRYWPVVDVFAPPMGPPQPVMLFVKGTRWHEQDMKMRRLLSPRDGPYKLSRIEGTLTPLPQEARAPLEALGYRPAPVAVALHAFDDPAQESSVHLAMFGAAILGALLLFGMSRFARR